MKNRETPLHPFIPARELKKITTSEYFRAENIARFCKALRRFRHKFNGQFMS